MFAFVNYSKKCTFLVAQQTTRSSYFNFFLTCNTKFQKADSFRIVILSTAGDPWIMLQHQ